MAISETKAPNVRPHAQALRGHAVRKGAISDEARASNGTADAFDTIQSHFEVLSDIVNTLVGIQNSASAPSVQSYLYQGMLSVGAYQPNVANGVVHQISLTANATINAVTGVSTSTFPFLVLLLTQDATGGRTLTWDATYKGVSGFSIDRRANKSSVFVFFFRPSDLLPVLTCAPLTGF